jgi:hypothetical protein
MKTGFLHAIAISAALLGATAAQAHRQWMLPSSTVLSGQSSWVTVDAAVSNDLFYFEHQPVRLGNVKAWAPDGSEGKIQNGSAGRVRSTFEVQLDKPGTWRIGTVQSGIGGTFKVDGVEWRLGGRRPGGPGGADELREPVGQVAASALRAGVEYGCLHVRLLVQDGKTGRVGLGSVSEEGGADPPEGAYPHLCDRPDERGGIGDFGWVGCPVSAGAVSAVAVVVLPAVVDDQGAEAHVRRGSGFVEKALCVEVLMEGVPRTQHRGVLGSVHRGTGQAEGVADAGDGGFEGVACRIEDDLQRTVGQVGLEGEQQLGRLFDDSGPHGQVSVA